MYYLELNMPKVTYQYPQGPAKEIGQVVDYSNNHVTIEFYASRLPPVRFKRNYDNTFTALGTTNKISFIIEL